jgi:glutamate carboxypeptidase
VTDVSLVERLVSIESPSADVAATSRCADELVAIATEYIETPVERIVIDGRTHLRWRADPTRVVLLGHLDTVWPLGTLARWPFSVDGDRMTGPGVFDMKAGLIQMLTALRGLPTQAGITVLVTSDEEVGSPTSRQLIEDTCRDAAAVLVLEPSADGALKIARKGVGMYRIEITGRASHAGLEPYAGINATVEAAHQVLAVAGLGDPSTGTTVTPTVMASGTTVNTVPAAASIAVDVRAETMAELTRVEHALESLTPVVPGAHVRAVAESVRPPLERAMSAALFEQAQRVAGELGQDRLDGCAVGGGSDGNFTAGLGVPTLDGLGAIGGNAHAEAEWASVAAMDARSALLAGLLTKVREGSS